MALFFQLCTIVYNYIVFVKKVPHHEFNSEQKDFTIWGLNSRRVGLKWLHSVCAYYAISSVDIYMAGIVTATTRYHLLIFQYLEVC